MSFRIAFPISVKIDVVVLIGITLTINHFRYYSHFNSISCCNL